MAFQAAFYKGTNPSYVGWFNRFVRWWTHGSYSHMEILFSDGISASSTWKGGGVHFVNTIYNLTDWDMVDLPPSLETNSRAWFKSNENKAYDYWADARFILGFVPSSKDKYQCAEACMLSLGFEDAWRFEPNISKSAAIRLK